jgi:hypothetical protein
MASCWVLLIIVLSVSKANVVSPRARWDAAFLAAASLHGANFEGGAIRPHLEGYEAAASVLVALVAAGPVAALLQKLDAREPYRGSLEAAAFAGIAASFPESLAGPGPSQVISFVLGLGMAAAAGRSKCLGLAPAFMYATGLLVYPTIVDSRVAPHGSVINVITAALLSTCVAAAAATWQRGQVSGTTAQN